MARADGRASTGDLASRAPDACADADAAFAADPSAVYAFVGRFFVALRDAGVEHVVISPGSRSTPLAIVARKTPGLRTWIELDERSAGFFALGLAKASGRPALLVCTSGTAAANYLPAVIEAHYSRVPLLLATADRPPELRDWGAGQTIDQVGLFGRYPRWAAEVPIPTAGSAARRYASQLAARAVDAACARPAGAVHLNWPLREPLAPPPGALASIMAKTSEASKTDATPEYSSSPSAHAPEDLSKLVALARACERGVICCGPMDPESTLLGAIADFSAASGWPVLADPAANLRSGLASGRAPILERGDAFLRSEVFTARHRPDFVLRIGETPVSKAQRLWIEAAEPREIWWLDEGGHWGEPSHRATRIVHGGAASLLEAATKALTQGPSRRQSDWCRAFEVANARAGDAIEAHVAAGENWSGLAVASALSRMAPAGAQLFASNSMPIRLLDLGFRVRPDPLRVLCSRGASGIDGLNSTALGVAAAGGTSVLLTGDLAFLHDLSGLLLSSRESIPLTIVVIDDNGGGIFSFLPVAAQAEDVEFEALFRTPHGVDLARAAALFELDYAAVDDLGALEAAITQGVSNPGVSIVHVRLDARENEARFRSAVAAACAAVDAEWAG